MQVGERSHWTADGSPLLLRSLPGSKFELEKGGAALTLDHEDDDPAKDPDRHKGEILVREDNPDPGTRVMLTTAGGPLKIPAGHAGLDDDGIARIDDILADQDSVDLMTVDVDSGVITRQEIGRLGHLADRHEIPVEIHLHGDG